jgi:hypothetical protein
MDPSEWKGCSRELACSPIHRRWLECERGRATFRGSFPLRAFPVPSLYTPTFENPRSAHFGDTPSAILRS